MLYLICLTRLDTQGSLTEELGNLNVESTSSCNSTVPTSDENKHDEVFTPKDLVEDHYSAEKCSSPEENETVLKDDHQNRLFTAKTI